MFCLFYALCKNLLYCCVVRNDFNTKHSWSKYSVPVIELCIWHLTPYWKFVCHKVRYIQYTVHLCWIYHNTQTTPLTQPSKCFARHHHNRIGFFRRACVRSPMRNGVLFWYWVILLKHSDRKMSGHSASGQIIQSKFINWIQFKIGGRPVFAPKFHADHGELLDAQLIRMSAVLIRTIRVSHCVQDTDTPNGYLFHFRPSFVVQLLCVAVRSPTIVRLASLLSPSLFLPRRFGFSIINTKMISPCAQTDRLKIYWQPTVLRRAFFRVQFQSRFHRICARCTHILFHLTSFCCSFVYKIIQSNRAFSSFDTAFIRFEFNQVCVLAVPLNNIAP